MADNIAFVEINPMQSEISDLSTDDISLRVVKSRFSSEYTVEFIDDIKHSY